MPDAIESEPRSRRLATVRRISELLPIGGADRIELAIVDGWQVVAQKGIYEPGDACVYLEIDSWVPSTVAPFLTKEGHYAKSYQGIEGERLKTIRLRGQISQGLLLPLSALDGIDGQIDIGSDVTDALGILKWERPLPSALQGISLGYFPSELRKTDQERVQNCRELLDVPDRWETSIKLDGSSMTVYIDDDDAFHVCSRNLRLKETAGNAFWDAARQHDLEAKLRSLNDFCGTRLAIQGELCGPSIQGNKDGFTGLRFFAFDIWDIEERQYLAPDSRVGFAVSADLPHVPTLDDLITPAPLAAILEMATGPSINAPLREGLVFKSRTRPGVSFKAISNEWLLKHGE